jgi:FkbM family methyltransferase
MSIRTKLIQAVIDVNEKLIFYPQLRKFYTPLIKNGAITVFDVGSNKGQSIEFFLSINSGARIFAFEPNRKLYDKLTKKYSDNNNIKLFNCGVSSRKGMLMFQENVLDETSTFEPLNYDSEYLIKKAKVLGVDKKELIVSTYEVEVTTLSDVLAGHPGLHVDVLKIDVEGHELQVLLGLFSEPGSKIPVRFLQLESHKDDMYLNSGQEKIAGLLADHGFVEVAKFKHGFGDFYEIIYENKRK